MLSIVDFFRKVLPHAPFYAGAFLPPGSEVLKQKAFGSIEELAQFAKIATDSGFNTFFGLSGFSQTWHDDPTGAISAKTGKVKKVFRTQANAVAQRAFWLDIDCGADKPYATKNAARDALIRFLTATGLPCPMIVSSGNGLHCYWPLNADVPTAQWERYAACIDALTKHFGLNVDSTRTMDAASVLRPVGTMNFKATPKPVKVLIDQQPIDVIQFCTAVAGAMKRSGIKPTKRSAKNVNVAMRLPEGLSENAAFMAAMGGAVQMGAPDKDAELIISRCQQIREAGLSTEPVWFGMMKVMTFCPDGERYAREISAQDTRRHNDAAFTAKYRYAESLTGGPALCETFNRECPGKCQSCPYWKSISSPAELGRKDKQGQIAPQTITLGDAPTPTPAAAPVQQAAPAEPVTPPANPMGMTMPTGPITAQTVAQPAQATNPGVTKTDGVATYTIPPLNSKFYDVVPGKGVFQLVYGEDEETGGERVVSTIPLMKDATLRPLCAQRHRVNRMEQELFYIWLHERTGLAPREVRMTAKDFQSAAALQGWLFNNGLLAEPHLEKNFIQYMKAYLAKVQSSIPTIEVRDHFGWVDGKDAQGKPFEGFVLGDTLYAPGMPPQLSAASSQLEQYTATSMRGSQGSLDEWKRVPEMYNKPGMEWGQFGMCLAFGSIFMKHMPGNAKNGIVNFYSTESGTGKTTLQEAINSVWGNPHAQLLNVVSSANARYSIMSHRRNLPICINETTNMDDRVLSEMLFTISEGVEKSTLTQERALRQPGSWQTTTIMSANNTVLQKMLNYSSQRNGELMRALDVRVTMSKLDKEYVMGVTDAMSTNFGVAGHAFIQFLMENPNIMAEVPASLRAWMAKHGGPQDERFWESICAAAIVGGSIACMAGLLPFDMKVVHQFCIQLIKNQRSQLLSGKNSSTSYLADFMADKRRETLIVSKADRDPMNDMGGVGGDDYVKYLPQGSLDVRYELDSRTVYVRAEPFRKWCRERRLEVEVVLNSLVVAHQYTPPSGKSRTTKYPLARGVDSLPPERPNVFKFQLPDDAELTGVSEDVTEAE